MTVAEFNLQLHQHFPGAPYCLDHLSTLATGPGKAHIDIFKLDDWIIRRHGAYEGSMHDRVKELFGDRAVAWLESLLKTEEKKS